MRYLASLLFYPLLVIGQITEYNEGKYAFFPISNTDSLIHPEDINWSNENLCSEFTLNGEAQLRYEIRLVNDTIAALSKFENGIYVFQEDIPYTDWALRRIEDGGIISEFKITDFDKDGDEDLTCWVFSNVNGNEWTRLYLNDKHTKKLVKLENTAEEDDLWDRPTYDPVTQTINCILDASAYGVSNESTYRLSDLNAVPLKKHEEDRQNPRYIIDKYYIGKNGKWKLIKTKRQR